jgi:hypothetical protein
MFGGRVEFTLPDGTVLGTPYWNRFYKAPVGPKKIVRAFFMGSMGGRRNRPDRPFYSNFQSSP